MDGLNLRPALPADAAQLRRWDQAPHVVEAKSDEDWQWEVELARTPPWREQLVAELDGTPIGFVEIIDPRADEEHYWGVDVASNLRALDLWIGEPTLVGCGLGTMILRRALGRCFASSDVAAVLVDPLAGNSGAQRFYERLGFERVGPRRFGRDDCIVYRLERSTWQAWQQATLEQRIAQVYFIGASLERVWDALTNPDVTERYWHDTRIESDWTAGARIRYRRHGEITDEHTILGIDAPRRLSHTFRPLFGEYRHEPPSQVRFDLVAGRAVVRLSVEHDGFAPHSKVFAACREGWPQILSGLKTLLETGRPLPPFEPLAVSSAAGPEDGGVA